MLLSETLSAFLLERGFPEAKLSATGKHGLTPLMHAAWSGREDLVDELLAHGADVFVRNADGNTALWLACVGNCHAVVRKLVAAGAELNHQNDVGATVLMYAASSGKPELVKELLTLGADPYRTNQDGIKAGEMAATARCLAHLRHTLH